MAQTKIKSPKAALCLFFALVMAAGVIIFFVIGGIFFGKENPKVKYYKNTMCQVDGRSYRTYQCSSRYYTYICYGPIWYAHYTLGNATIQAIVEQEKRYRSYSDAIDKANEYAINGNYSCWYDTRSPSVAQWDRPSTTVAIILLACGGLSVLLSALLFFLTYRFIQEYRMQNQQNFIHPPSYGSVYLKQ